MDYPLEGKIGVVAGWGKTDNSFGKTGTNLLNKVRSLTQGLLFDFPDEINHKILALKP